MMCDGLVGIALMSVRNAENTLGEREIGIKIEGLMTRANSGVVLTQQRCNKSEHRVGPSVMLVNGKGALSRL